MSLNMSNVSGTLSLYACAKEGLYDIANGCGDGAIVFAPILGLAKGSLVLARDIGFLGEAIFKGIGNIIGSPFTDECSATKGFRQIIFLVPVALAIVALSPLHALAKAIYTTVRLMFDHTNYINGKAEPLHRTHAGMGAALAEAMFLHPILFTQTVLSEVC